MVSADTKPLNLYHGNILNANLCLYFLKEESLQKDEVIQLHTFLVHIKMYLKYLDENNDPSVFTDYDHLDVAPQNVYRSKKDHEHAVFVLTRGIEKLFHQI
jgi:hypothetical protein